MLFSEVPEAAARTANSSGIAAHANMLSYGGLPMQNIYLELSVAAIQVSGTYEFSYYKTIPGTEGRKFSFGSSVFHLNFPGQVVKPSQFGRTMFRRIT